MILGYLGFAFLALTMTVGVMVPFLMVGRKSAVRAEATSNARQIGMALVTFEQDYHMFPCDATAAQVKTANPEIKFPMGTTFSNDYFRQLIAAGVIANGKPFYARIADCRRPANPVNDADALGKGECGFSYIVDCNSMADPPQPLVVTPLIRGTERFDPFPFGAKAIVVWTDGSVTTPAIDQSGHVIHLGVNLLDPGNPVWHGKPPRIAWPEL